MQNDIGTPADTLDAVLIAKAVSALPEKHRAAVRWSYVHCGNPVAMARTLGVSKQGLADLVDAGRTMLQTGLVNPKNSATPSQKIPLQVAQKFRYTCSKTSAPGGRHPL